MSSTITTYDISVPIIVRSLEQLQAFLRKGEQWAKDNGKDPQTLVDARIVDDMKPLPFQIQGCCNSAKALLPRIGGQEVDAVEDNEKTFEDLYARIASTITLLRAAKREKFVAPDTKVVVKSGGWEAEFEALGYVQKFALPNFFFHVTTAYNILRKEGVPVGKMDFLGAGDITTWGM